MQMLGDLRRELRVGAHRPGEHLSGCVIAQQEMDKLVAIEAEADQIVDPVVGPLPCRQVDVVKMNGTLGVSNPAPRAAAAITTPRFQTPDPVLILDRPFPLAGSRKASIASLPTPSRLCSRSRPVNLVEAVLGAELARLGGNRFVAVQAKAEATTLRTASCLSRRKMRQTRLAVFLPCRHISTAAKAPASEPSESRVDSVWVKTQTTGSLSPGASLFMRSPDQFRVSGGALGNRASSCSSSYMNLGGDSDS